MWITPELLAASAGDALLAGGGAAVHPPIASSVISRPYGWASDGPTSALSHTHMDDDVATTFRGFLLDSPKIWGLEVKAQTLSSREHARERASAMSGERGCRTGPRASGRGFRLMS